jgi:hypothetical protein
MSSFHPLSQEAREARREQRLFDELEDLSQRRPSVRASGDVDELIALNRRVYEIERELGQETLTDEGAHS